MARGNHTGHFFCPPSASPHPITASSSTEFKIHNPQFGQLLQQAYLTWNMSIYICAKYQHLVFVARCPLFMMIHSTSENMELLRCLLQSYRHRREWGSPSKSKKCSSLEQLGKVQLGKGPSRPALWSGACQFGLIALNYPKLACFPARILSQPLLK